MKLFSKEDPSVNFVEDALQGFLESRYVRKCPEYFICYLSSQSGCNHGCRFCWLTATKQTKFENVLAVDYLAQASRVLKHYWQDGTKAKYVHYNFMARGEALANPNFVNGTDSILYDLGRLATSFDSGLGVRFNVSTILPKSMTVGLTDIFKVVHPTIYYSLYSLNDDFRKKWMPQAMPVGRALGLLKDYQVFSKKTVKVHHCFIEGENDSHSDVAGMLAAFKEHRLDVEFNLVRYNPHSKAQGSESPQSVIDHLMGVLSRELGSDKVKVIPKVGPDVFASCGMFVDKEGGVVSA